MLSSFSSALMNHNIFLSSIGVFSDVEFLEKINFRDLDLRLFLRLMVEMKCEERLRPVNIGKEKVRCCNGRRIGLAQLVEMFWTTCQVN